MKHMKKSTLYVMTLVVTGLLFAVSLSAAIQQDNHEEKTLLISKNIRKSYLKAESNSIINSMSNQKPIIKPKTIRDNLPIISTYYDCQDPAIASDGSNILVIAEEVQDLFESNIMLIFSTDSGNNWEDLYSFTMDGTLEELPVLDYCGNTDFEAYATCLPDPEEERFHMFHFPSMTDPDKVWQDSEGWVEWGFEISGYYEEFKDIDVAGYMHGDIAPYPDFHGIILSSCIDSDTGLDTISLIYETESPGLQLLYMPEVAGEIGQLSCDIDLSTGNYFEAMEWKNEPDMIDDGVWFDFAWLEPGNPDWWMTDWAGYALEGASNPDVAADSGNVYCACEVNGEIICFYSQDNMATLENSTVTTSGQFPSITAIGEIVICTYFDDGNLYKAISEDSGVTWGEPTMINDEPGSASTRAHGVDAKGQFVAWTDERNMPTEIFFDKTVAVGSPPGAPQITGPTNGDSGDPITFTFKAVDPDGDDVRFIINWGDGDSDTTSFVSSGTDKTATHTWGPGGDYIIKIKAEDSNGLIGPESTLDINIPRKRARFYNLFDIFPNLFRILNIIFG